MQPINPNLFQTFEDMEDPLSQHLSKILSAISQFSDEVDERLRLFAPMTGHLWDGGLMFVGRALYGWATEEFTAEEAKNEDKRSELVKDAWTISRTKTGDCPILRLHNCWQDERKSKLSAYNPNRSAFWRLIRSLSQTRISSTGMVSPWHSTIYWTNLYKVNPASTGNPGKALVAAQQQACIDMLRCEIEAKKPEAVVFLTGWHGWAMPFVEGMKTESLTIQPDAILQAHGQFISSNQKSAFVVVPHPQGKPVKQMASAALNGIRQNIASPQQPLAPSDLGKAATNEWVVPTLK